MLKIFAGFTLFIICLANAHAARLPKEVLTALKQSNIPLTATGIVVRQVNAKSPLIQINTQQSMNPASTMKLLTTYAALELLGPAYVWKTEAYLDGKLDNGVLRGNLILKGYGNPKLTVEQLWLWLSELRARGLRDIQGDLILDRSAFELPAHNPAEFDNDPLRAYNVGPDALLLNFNTLRLRYLPDGNQLKVFSTPPLDNIEIINQLAPQTAPNCDNWDDTIRIKARGDSVVFEGGYPSECGEREQNINVMPHTRYVASMFNAIWKEVGGTYIGNTREGNLTGSAKLFATHYSEPLALIIRDINKFSNNVMARQLFISLSLPGGQNPPQTLTSPAPASQPPVSEADSAATIPRSIQITKHWLTQKKLNFPELVIENGAGLSRLERISPKHLADLLQSATESPLNAEFTASLPILGVDGSLRKRLKSSPATRNAHLKTGTLEGVKTVAGYVKSKNGKEWILVFFINHPNAKHAGAAQDALIEWVQKH
ncbi:MAG: D-alanyl-D-alanine carboxypeptidase/D-alanyl-D-alanine-endopeptidase [Gallionellaceae bacterium]|jgi:D-alanyl-D-alanine carboxypeptidase/D-alanyl-D-alanine-endopeptidase (penicillin-binding protein 4)